MAKTDISVVAESEELNQKPAKKGKFTKRKEQLGTNQGLPTFWQKVAGIPKPDWGARCNIYLYRVEPIIDRTRGGGSQTYVEKYGEPISEERVLADYGSGRYKLMLNFRKPGAEQGDEIDSIYIDLLNEKYPPKVPAGEWVDDPRNKKWAWAKQHFAKDPGAAIQNPIDAAHDALDLAERLQPKDQVKTTLDTIKGVKELFPQPAKDPTQDLATVVAVAKDLAALQKPPDSKGMDDWIRAELSAQRERSDRLMMMLLDKKNGDGNGFSVVKELVGGIKELIPGVKELFPSLGEVGGTKSHLNGWQEFTVAMAPHATQLLSPFAGLISWAIQQQMAQKMQQQPGAARPNPGQPPPQSGQAPAPQQQLQPAGQPAGPPQMMPFLQSIVFPMRTFIRFISLEHRAAADVGVEFAGWVYNGFGADPQYEQAMLISRSMGPIGIIAQLKQHAGIWSDKGERNDLPSIAELEPVLPAFFDAFLKWEPESEDEPEPEDLITPAARPAVVQFDEGGYTG